MYIVSKKRKHEYETQWQKLCRNINNEYDITQLRDVAHQNGVDTKSKKKKEICELVADEYMKLDYMNKFFTDGINNDNHVNILLNCIINDIPKSKEYLIMDDKIVFNSIIVEKNNKEEIMTKFKSYTPTLTNKNKIYIWPITIVFNGVNYFDATKDKDYYAEHQNAFLCYWDKLANRWIGFRYEPYYEPQHERQKIVNNLISNLFAPIVELKSVNPTYKYVGAQTIHQGKLCVFYSLYFFDLVIRSIVKYEGYDSTNIRHTVKKINMTVKNNTFKMKFLLFLQHLYSLSAKIDRKDIFYDIPSLYK